MSDPSDSQRPVDQRAATNSESRLGTSLVADLGVLVLALGTAVGASRLFVGRDFLRPSWIVVFVSWLTAVLLRRAGIRISLAALIHTLVGVVTLSLVLLPATTALGVPLPGTFSTAWSEVTDAFLGIRKMVPPVEATTGFQIVFCLGLWLLVLYADTAARRVDAVVQAAVPFVITFLALGVPGNGAGRTLSSVCFLASLTAYAVTAQFSRSMQLRWAGGSSRARAGSRSVARAALGIAAVGTVVALIGGAVLPDQSRRIDLRQIGRGPGQRTVVSPFVSITTLLGARSNSEMFRVRASQPSYWRLTALGAYDEERSIWVSHSTYSKLESPLPRSSDRSVPTEQLRQDFKIANLSGPWLPAAFEPKQISGDVDPTYDELSSSLIAGENDPGDLEYTVKSLLPDFAGLNKKGRRFGGPSGSAAGLTEEDLLKVPELPFQVEQIFDDVTSETRDPFEQMKLLQDWFRSKFTYDETVNYARSSNPLLEFFQQRRGFCQQFSSAFALLARHAGLPSRVAVGFTQGDASTPETAGPKGSADTEYVVRGRNAHAWPEVYFEGYGWVAFEPTPGRGNPATTSFTGIPGAQAAPAETTTTTTAPETATTDVASPSTVPATTQPPRSSTSPESQDSGSGRSPVALSIFVAVVAGLLAAAFVVLRSSQASKRRTRLRLGGQSEAIREAWADSLRSLATLGIVMHRSETPLEFARRAEAELQDRVDTQPNDDQPDGDRPGGGYGVPAAELALLAEAETFRRYGQEFADDSTSTRPDHMVSALEAAAATIERFAKQLSNRRLSPALRSVRP